MTANPQVELPIGPPLAFDAAIFDMDGVVTQTARLHAAAWKELFDNVLQRMATNDAPFVPFDERSDYLRYVDGKPRLDGVRSLLKARGISLPEGHDGDSPLAMTVHGLARKKGEVFARRLREYGVETFPSTVTLIERLRACGVRTGLVTPSRHGREILQAAGIEGLFDARLDGIDLDERGLQGKPAPDMLVASSEALGTSPERTVVVEEALAGVEAGRRGGFGLVVGVDRTDIGAALASAGADVVASDLSEIDPDRLDALFRERQEALAWRVDAEGYDPAREHALESLFALGNGYLGVRGSLPMPSTWRDLFVAGVYDRKDVTSAYSELDLLAPERKGSRFAQLVRFPFPFHTELRIEGEPQPFGSSCWHDVRRRLDLARGMLDGEATHETPDGRRTRGSARMCASLADPHLLLQELVAFRENHFAAIELTATLAQNEELAQNPAVRLLEHVVIGDLELIRYATHSSGYEVCMVCRATGSGFEPLSLRRMIAVFTSRDVPDPRTAALSHIEKIPASDFDTLWQQHERAWREFWRDADIRIDTDPGAERALRFAGYHLRSAVDHDPRVSVPARALTGRAYEGHVFWDTEIFMLPFYLLTEPSIAKNLLLYRYNTLDGARKRAHDFGYSGACFAWESTVTGEDVTPTEIVLRSTQTVIPIFTGSQQVHVAADIAYTVWLYWEATRDEEFLRGPGAELLFETARFWASRVMMSADREYHIRGVVGPDEYHHDIDDNAYTNWMARFNLERAVHVAESFRISASARIDADEPVRWKQIAEGLYCPRPNDRGVIEQFAGFFELEDYPLSREERFKAPIRRLFDWEKINRMKLVKQADVLMLPLLFPDAFSEDVVMANYRYYEPLTDHASSLSPPVHAAIAARLGLYEDAERYWKQSLTLDLSDKMDNSELGIHPAAMGGTWQALVFGGLGVRFTDDGPKIDPKSAACLPAGWRSVSLKLAWRGDRYPVNVRAQGRRS